MLQFLFVLNPREARLCLLALKCLQEPIRGPGLPPSGGLAILVTFLGYKLGPPPQPEGSPVLRLEKRECAPVEPLSKNVAHSRWLKTAEILQVGRSVRFMKDVGMVLNLYSKQEFLRLQTGAFASGYKFLKCTAS